MPSIPAIFRVPLRVPATEQSLDNPAPHALLLPDMKTHSLMAVIVAGLLAPLMGQTTEAPPLDYDARVKSVVTLKEHIAQREARFETLKKDLLELDARVEERVDFIVKSLITLKDSNDSKTRVANLKEEVIAGLRRSIVAYRQKRMEIFERQRKEQTVPVAELAANIDMFDKRIGKRIAQIMELVQSLPGHQDVAKYESDGGSGYANGWYEESSRISDEWRQNRRQSANTDSERRDLLQDLTKALDTNDSRRRSLAQDLTSTNLSPKDRRLKEQELGRVDALIDNLKSRRREIALPGDTASREIGMSEASDVGKMVNDAREDLAGDFSDIFRKFAELDKERTRIRSLENNLKDREEWLQKNPLPAK